MSGERKECVTLWLRIYLLTRDPWALSLFSLVQQLAMLRVVAAPSPLVPNGYDEQISLRPLWTYSIRNKSLCFRQWDFGGICYCSITSPVWSIRVMRVMSQNEGCKVLPVPRPSILFPFEAGFHVWPRTHSLVLTIGFACVPETKFTPWSWFCLEEPCHVSVTKFRSL